MNRDLEHQRGDSPDVRSKGGGSISVSRELLDKDGYLKKTMRLLSR